MTEKERRLLLKILSYSSDLLGNRICNDTPKEWLEEFTKKELKEINHKMNIQNGVSDKKDEQYSPDMYKYDFCLVYYLQCLVDEEKETISKDKEFIKIILDGHVYQIKKHMDDVDKIIKKIYGLWNEMNENE